MDCAAGCTDDQRKCFEPKQHGSLKCVDVASFINTMLFFVSSALVLSTLRQTDLSSSRVCSICLYFRRISVNHFNDHNK